MTYCFLMLAQSGVDDAHVEQNLARVGDFVEFAKSIVELIVVVPTQGRDPSLNLLRKPTVSAYATPPSNNTTRPLLLPVSTTLCLSIRESTTMAAEWLAEQLRMEEYISNAHGEIGASQCWGAR